MLVVEIFFAGLFDHILSTAAATSIITDDDDIVIFSVAQLHNRAT